MSVSATSSGVKTCSQRAEFVHQLLGGYVGYGMDTLWYTNLAMVYPKFQ